MFTYTKYILGATFICLSMLTIANDSIAKKSSQYKIGQKQADIENNELYCDLNLLSIDSDCSNENKPSGKPPIINEDILKGIIS